MTEIITGVDGSEHGLRAAEWAAAEATRRGAALRIVHALEPWTFAASGDQLVRDIRAWMRDCGRQVVDAAAVRVREHAPGVRMSTPLAPGSPAAALIEAAGDADMLVVGGHGSGVLTGMLLGSVALQVATYAPCPAVIVRQAPAETAAGREVVVGVDGSDSCRPAIGFGFEEAALRKARLRAVIAWTHPVSAGPGDMQPLVMDPKLVAAGEERVLAETMAGWREKFPDVEVAYEVVRGRPVRALAAASASADLLVVGTRGRGGFTGLVLGSTSHALIHHSRCPLAIVPSGQH